MLFIQVPRINILYYRYYLIGKERNSLYEEDMISTTIILYYIIGN